MNINGHTIGVCSWSLHPKDTADLVAQLQQIGVGHVQLALVPLTQLDDAEQARQIDQLRAANIQLTGGMLGFALRQSPSPRRRYPSASCAASFRIWPWRARPLPPQCAA